MEKFKELIDDPFDSILESLEQNYSVWFNALHKPAFQKYLSELEELTRSIAATAPRFDSFDANRTLGTMFIKYHDKSLIFANGSYKLIRPKNKASELTL